MLEQALLVAVHQFAALTVLLDDGSAFLAFRGTDGTLVGWKEDFNLSADSTSASTAPKGARARDRSPRQLR